MESFIICIAWTGLLGLKRHRGEWGWAMWTFLGEKVDGVGDEAGNNQLYRFLLYNPIKSY